MINIQYQTFHNNTGTFQISNYPFFNIWKIMIFILNLRLYNQKYTLIRYWLEKRNSATHRHPIAQYTCFKKAGELQKSHPCLACLHLLTIQEQKRQFITTMMVPLISLKYLLENILQISAFLRKKKALIFIAIATFIMIIKGKPPLVPLAKYCEPA